MLIFSQLRYPQNIFEYLVVILNEKRHLLKLAFYEITILMLAEMISGGCTSIHPHFIIIPVAKEDFLRSLFFLYLFLKTD